jgi:hypothetical protein
MGDDIGYWNISAYNRGMMGYRTPNDTPPRQGSLESYRILPAMQSHFARVFNVALRCGLPCDPPTGTVSQLSSSEADPPKAYAPLADGFNDYNHLRNTVL